MGLFRRPWRAPVRPHWVSVSWGVLLVGVATAAATGWVWAGAVHRDDRSAFDARASAVAGAVVTGWQRDVDLTAMIRALYEANPDLSGADLAQTLRSMGAASRYPGALGGSFVARVPAAQLSRWDAASAASFPAVTGLPAAIPSGSRATYCLMRGLASPSEAAMSLVPDPAVMAVVARVDWCRTPLAPRYAQATASGTFVAARFPMAWLVSALRTLPALRGPPASALGPTATTLAAMQATDEVIAPVYTGPVGPSPGRDGPRPVAGWVGMLFNADQVVDDPSVSASGLQVTLSEVLPGGVRTVLARSHPAHPSGGFSTTVTVRANGTWLVSVTGSAAGAGLSPAAQGAIVALAGAALAGLLFAVLRMLAGSRARALALVDAKTAELRHQALHDALTGLPNRALVLDRAEQMLARGRRDHTRVAVLFVDLDNFKDINDSLGHNAGDQLLCGVAERLRVAVRESDTVGRLGGDEFVVLVDESSLLAGPELVAERLLEVLREPFRLGDGGGADYTVSASVGVADGVRPTAEELLRDADLALYEAKASGKGRYAVFAEQMRYAVNSRLALEMDLREALDRDEFFLLYQPTFTIRDGAPTGVEALLRWRHPTRGVVGPDEFIPALEESGLIIPVGRWVLDRACAEGASLEAKGYPISVAVNVSARQLEAGTVADDVASALARHGIEPGRLVIEITEGTLMRDAAATVTRLEALKALGVRVAIDDFGTGYSSLAYVRQFPVDILKIDRSFIAAMHESRESAALVHTLVQLGKTLGLETVAEGIEDQQQLHRLQDERCDTGQGFFYSRPAQPADLETFLARRFGAGASRAAAPEPAPAPPVRRPVPARVPETTPHL